MRRLHVRRGDARRNERRRRLNVSIAIQHHPARADLARALLSAIPGAELVADPEPDGTPNPWRTYRRAIETAPADCDYRLILQDDVLPCRGFAAAARVALAAADPEVVTFYVGGNLRLGAARVAFAASRGSSWATIPQFSWFPAVATAWPQRLLGELLAYVDRQRWPASFRADDEILGRFLRARGEVPLATVPSLIDHPDDVPSLIGTRARGGLDRNRVAACWVGDCDVSTIDWSR